MLQSDTVANGNTVRDGVPVALVCTLANTSTIAESG